MSAYAQYVLSGLSLGCIYALVALGIVLIVNVTGVYNFAVGNYVMFGGLIMYGTAGVGGWSVPLAIIVTAAAVAGIALLQERLTIAPVRGKVGPLGLMITTIGVGSVLQGAALAIWGEYTKGVPPFTAGSFVLARRPPQLPDPLHLGRHVDLPRRDRLPLPLHRPRPGDAGERDQPGRRPPARDPHRLHLDDGLRPHRRPRRRDRRGHRAGHLGQLERRPRSHPRRLHRRRPGGLHQPRSSGPLRPRAGRVAVVGGGQDLLRIPDGDRLRDADRLPSRPRSDRPGRRAPADVEALPRQSGIRRGGPRPPATDPRAHGGLRRAHGGRRAAPARGLRRYRPALAVADPAALRRLLRARDHQRRSASSRPQPTSSSGRSARPDWG